MRYVNSSDNLYSFLALIFIASIIYLIFALIFLNDKSIKNLNLKQITGYILFIGLALIARTGYGFVFQSPEDLVVYPETFRMKVIDEVQMKEKTVNNQSIYVSIAGLEGRMSQKNVEKTLEEAREKPEVVHKYDIVYNKGDRGEDKEYTRTYTYNFDLEDLIKYEALDDYYELLDKYEEIYKDLTENPTYN